MYEQMKARDPKKKISYNHIFLEDILIIFIVFYHLFTINSSVVFFSFLRVRKDTCHYAG